MKNNTIVILTYGSRGDVQPLVALGTGLQQRGCRVRMAAPAVFESFVQAHGIEFVPLAGDPAELSRVFVENSGASWSKVVRSMYDYVMPIALQVMSQVDAACEGAGAVLHTFLMTIAGHEAARRRGIPDYSVQLFPAFIPTPQYPALLMPDLPLGPGYRRMTHRLNSLSFWIGSRLGYFFLQRQNPGLPRLSGWPFSKPLAERPPLLFGFSRHVLPPPPEWQGRAHVCGYWFLDEEAGWQPDPALELFIQSGPPPVYIGFGSVVTQSADRLAQIAIEALRISGQRGVLSLGWGGLAPQELPENVFAIQSAPHSWLFPKMAAVVHHGGAGTTAAGLRAGVPSILIPFTTDQPFWAQQVTRLGVGPAPIPAQQLDAQSLADRIQTAIQDQAMRARAAELGALIRTENGVESVVQVLAA